MSTDHDLVEETSLDPRLQCAAFDLGMLSEITEWEHSMIGKCPKCDATPNIIVEALRARDESSQRTLPVLQFLCDRCKTILSIALDPEWQAQVVAGQLRAVDKGSASSQ
jgi:phage FluMu protein Com